jgi:hypothetical protein
MEVLEEQHNMPYTLRRPMFRGGKPNAYGTGITSNLESRRGFANGPEEEMLSPDVTVDPQVREEYARAYGQNIREQMTPSRQEQVLDFLRAFGASAAPAGEFQTLGSALGKTGVNFETIFGPKIQAARKSGTEGYLAALKGVDEKKLFLYQQKALDLYNSNRQRFPTYKDALNFVLQDEFKQKDTAAADIEKITQSYINQFGYSYGPAYAKAFVDYQRARSQKVFETTGGDNYKGLVTEFFDIDSDGKVTTKPGQDKNVSPNNTFIDEQRNVYILGSVTKTKEGLLTGTLKPYYNK